MRKSILTIIIIVPLLLAGCIGELAPQPGPDPGPSPSPTDAPDPGPVVTTLPDGAMVGQRELRRLTTRESDATVRDVFARGADWAGAGLPPDRSSVAGFDNDVALLAVDDTRAEELAAAAERVADTVMQRGLAAAGVGACATPGRTCVAALLDGLAPRLLRRSVPAADKERYLTTYDRIIALGATPADGVKWSLVALLSSPYFLYRSELGEPAGDAYQLTGEEIATALAYDFSGAPPSDDLMARARRGELSDPAARLTEARRLLDSPRGHQVVEHFLERWLNYAEVRTLAKDERLVPGFAALRADLAEETRRFLEHIFFTRKGSVADLFTSADTFVSPALAAHYGLAAPAQPFGQVQRPAEQALGLLAQGSILARFALTDSTSPPQRGAFIRRRFMCQELPPPPPNVGQAPVPTPGVTTRERYQQVTAAPTCAGCHALINDVGFALENFDTAGRYRTTEEGKPINASGKLVGFGPTELTFATGRELAQHLAASPDVAHCVGSKMAVYTFGLAEASALPTTAQQTALASGASSLYEFLAQLTAAPHFTRRAPPR